MGDVYDAQDARDYAVGHDWPKEDRPYKLSSPGAGGGSPIQTSGYISVIPAKSRADLPDSAEARKEIPIVTGVLDYFPDAIAEVARVSFAGNQQHNPGQPLHWAREKSTDHEDCIGRHTLQRGTRDTDGQRHTAKRAWRALAALQIEIEEDRKRATWGTVGEPGQIIDIGPVCQERISERIKEASRAAQGMYGGGVTNAYPQHGNRTVYDHPSVDLHDFNRKGKV